MHDTSNPLARVARSTADFIESAVQNMAGKKPRQEQTVYELPRQRVDTGGFRTEGTLARVQQATPLSEEAKRELKITQLPPVTAEALAGVPFPTPDQARAFDTFLRECGYEPPHDVAAKLAQLDLPWLRLQDAIADSRKNQSANYHAHLADLANRTAAGDTTVNERDAWTREDWQQDADERCRVFKAKAREIEAEAWAIAQPALLAKADACDAAADELEAEIKPRFKQFAVPYRPAPYVLLLRKYAASLRDGSRRTVGKPTTMIETL